MALNTEYLNLIKPSQDDFYNIEDFNNNFDIIDINIKDIKNNESEINNNVSRNTSNISSLQNQNRLSSGTWTPRMYAGNYQIPLSSIICGYHRHGSIVVVNMFFYANLSSVPSSNRSNSVYITGFPYSAVNNTNISISTVSSPQPVYVSSAKLSQGVRIVANVLRNNFYLYYYNDSGNSSDFNVSALSRFSSTTEFSAVFTYSI